jgi:hypothetical protein
MEAARIATEVRIVALEELSVENRRMLGFMSDHRKVGVSDAEDRLGADSVRLRRAHGRLNDCRDAIRGITGIAMNNAAVVENAIQQVNAADAALRDAIGEVRVSIVAVNADIERWGAAVGRSKAPGNSEAKAAFVAEIRKNEKAGLDATEEALIRSLDALVGVRERLNARAGHLAAPREHPVFLRERPVFRHHGRRRRLP